MARKYTRDNRGRFASVGATARGGRLATASGKKRETQTAKIKGGAASGTIGKPKGLKPGALKPKTAAGGKSPLKRTGQKIAVPTLKTNSERGRQGVVSMSIGAKQARRGAVAERKAEKLARIKERQSEIVARRQGNRLSTYTTSGQFNQSAANLNQAKASRSKRLQQWLTTRDPASRPAGARATAAKPGASAPARRRGAVGKIDDAKAGRIIGRIDANRPGLRRASGSARKTANAIKTQRKAVDFALAAGARARKQGKSLSVNDSLRRAVANAAKKRRRSG